MGYGHDTSDLAGLSEEQLEARASRADLVLPPAVRDALRAYRDVHFDQGSYLGERSPSYAHRAYIELCAVLRRELDRTVVF